MKKKIWTPIIAIFLIAGSLYIYNASQSTVVVESHGDPIADFSDKKNLVGTADFVFLGEVLSNQDQTSDKRPMTIFNVRVITDIKGSIGQKEVLVNQYGGYTFEAGKKVLRIFEDDTLLSEGSKYILAAIQQKDGSLLLIPGYGNEKVTDTEHESLLLNEYQAAYKSNAATSEVQ